MESGRLFSSREKGYICLGDPTEEHTKSRNTFIRPFDPVIFYTCTPARTTEHGH